ncbi:hypothetical protein ES705_22934 [subsurface metagenome]
MTASLAVELSKVGVITLWWMPGGNLAFAKASGTSNDPDIWSWHLTFSGLVFGLTWQQRAVATNSGRSCLLVVLQGFDAQLHSVFVILETLWVLISDAAFKDFDGFRYVHSSSFRLDLAVSNLPQSFDYEVDSEKDGESQKDNAQDELNFEHSSPRG